LAHVAEFISELGVGLNLVFVSFCELVEAALKPAIDIFDLRFVSFTRSTFFSISALAASRFFLSFYSLSLAWVLPAYIIDYNRHKLLVIWG